ncbi:hypothetical protein H4R99_001585 [Coemansia sp. RSA 1722]|nr:hypothetical protein H4R99_001585 [Coemansia sp. RSA 1722]
MDNNSGAGPSNQASVPTDNPPAYTPFSYYNPAGAGAGAGQGANPTFSPNMFAAAGNSTNVRPIFPGPGPIAPGTPGPNMSQGIPSYYYMSNPNFVAPGFPMPPNSPLPLGNSIPSVHSPSYYAVPNSNAMTGTVAMPAYMSPQMHPASMIAPMPMPLGFAPPPPGSVAGSVVNSVHMPMPPLSARSRADSRSAAGSGSVRAGAGAASVRGSALQSPAIVRSMAGSAAGSARAPGSPNPSRAGSRAGSRAESRAGSSAGNRAASRAGSTVAAPAAEDSNSEPAPPAPEKTPEQKAFEEKKKFKMDIINKLVDGSVIVDTKFPGQAKIAQKAGVKAVLVVGDDKKDDWQKEHNVARPTQTHVFLKFIDAVAIPVIGMIRIGHEMEAKVMERIGANLIDESVRLDTFSENVGIDKTKFATPFVCDVKDLPEALKRIKEGASLLRTDSSNDASGDCQKTIATLHSIREAIEDIKEFTDDEVKAYASNEEVDEDLVAKIKELGRLPVPLFAAGGIATPADVAQVRLIGCDGVFVETRVFRGLDPEQRVAALVKASKEYTNAKLIAELSTSFKPEPK